ncbi:MAG: hypothetical protein NTV22_02705, partial [bacterium]|nr:hypothetical protein [bacterium]
APDLRMEDDKRAYLADIGTRIAKAHINSLRALGIEAKHLRDWEKLIGMRYEEYARDRHGVRAAAMQLEAEEQDLDMAGLAKIQLCVPVQAVAIGCHDHICRGKTEGKDDLFRLLVRSLGRFYVELRVRLEGGKITWLTRVRVAILRVFRRLRRKT